MRNNLNCKLKMERALKNNQKKKQQKEEIKEEKNLSSKTTKLQPSIKLKMDFSNFGKK